MKNTPTTFSWPQRVMLDQTKPARAVAVTLSAPDGAMCPQEQTTRGVAWLAEHGCVCQLAPHYFGNTGFLAGTPAEIAADLHAAVADEETAFILSAGGGYNANALLPHLDFDLIARARKPIVGLSNPTVLLNAVSTRTGLVTFHGPVLIHNLGSEEGLDAKTTKSFLDMLTGTSPEVVVEAESEWTWLREGNARGRLFGGNLWSLEHLLGTPYEPDWRQAILFIEDCFCELHQVYASLEHFKACGVFDQIAGLVVGIPLEVGETELPYTGSFNDVVMSVVGAYDFPVLANVHLGHTDRKLTMPIGAMCRVDQAANRLVFERN